jgi:hypothetical protein
MINLTANVSKKVPMPDLEFSSQSYSAGMEVEMASGASSEEIQKKLRALYGLLEASIDEQIRSCQAESGTYKDDATPRPKAESRRSRHTSGSANGGNGARLATKAQVKAIYVIARERGYTDQDIERHVSNSFGAQKPSALSIGEASRLIDTLKGNGKAGVHED